MEKPTNTFASLLARIRAGVHSHAPTKKGIAPVRDWALTLTVTALCLVGLFAVGAFEYVHTGVTGKVAAVAATRSYGVPDASVLEAMVARREERAVVFEALLAEYETVTSAPSEPVEGVGADEEVDDDVVPEDVETEPTSLDVNEDMPPELVP